MFDRVFRKVFWRDREGDAIGLGTTLQAGRLQVRFLIVSLEFFHWFNSFDLTIVLRVDSVSNRKEDQKYFLTTIPPCVGRDSSVGIATGYGLDGPGIESRQGEIFRTSPDRPWGPPNLLYNGYWVFPVGKERPGRDADPLPPSSTVVKKD